MRETTVQTPVKPVYKYLGKRNIGQTISIVKHAQSELQENFTTTLFEQTDKDEFLSVAQQSFESNTVLTQFINVLIEFETSNKTAIGHFLQLQNFILWVDLYDAIEDAFCFYILSLKQNIQFFTDKSSQATLRKMLIETEACYKEVILFVRNNKL